MRVAIGLIALSLVGGVVPTGFAGITYALQVLAGTAGALRAESPDVDLSIKSQGGKPPTQEVRPVTTADILQQLASVYSTVPEGA